MNFVPRLIFIVFFFNDTAPTEIYTLSLHDALPISRREYPESLKRGVLWIVHTGTPSTTSSRRYLYWCLVTSFGTRSSYASSEPTKELDRFEDAMRRARRRAGRYSHWSSSPV